MSYESTMPPAAAFTEPARPVVLLADDDEAFRKAVASLLAKSDYNIALAVNGREAIDQLQRHPVKVAILDLIMPQMEGIETILKIRELDASIKVIAISGGGRVSGENYLGIARKLGAHSVLAKPFTGELLLQAISRALAPLPVEDPVGVSSSSAADF